MNQRQAVAIIVAYHPQLAVLGDLCGSLAAEAAVIVVDNTEGAGIAPALLPPGTEVLALGTNTGIAHAQNVGIARALERGADFVVLFDQDSRVAPGFVGQLTRALDPGEPRVVAPRYVDEAHGFDLPSARLGPFGWPRPAYPPPGGGPYPVDIVIASGTAATRSVFALAGYPDAGLFIDLVDTDWCLRCRARGVPIHVVPEVVMRHRIGSASHRVGPLLVLEHSPVRCYYQVRNALLLFRRPYIPFLFAVRETVSIVLSRMLLLFFVARRSDYLGAYLAAIKDGLAGVVGKRPR
jgi:rhamnosyltransferase